MVGIALIAACLAVFRADPGLGIASAAVACMALDRTARVVAARTTRGRPMTPVEKVACFLGSIGLALVIVLVALIVFFVVSALGSWIANLLGESLHSLGVVALGGLVAFGTGLVAAGVAAARLRRAPWSGPMRGTEAKQDGRTALG